jgi:membrane-bound inhibitor of C-type lysozyme
LRHWTGLWLVGAFPLLLVTCADPPNQTANDALAGAGAATDIDTFAAENMESSANLSVPPVEAGPDDARTVVVGYFDAISAGRYDRAYALWEPGAAGMDAGAFAASFAKYRSYEADIGVPGRVDAGAGQRYVRVPVRVTATMRDNGEEVTLIGPITLHRTAAIDGATAAQRSWRIRETALKPRPAAMPSEATANYSCEDGPDFTARFDNDADTATIALTGEEAVVLAGQRPASGIWYAADGWELRGKGDEAMLTRPGEAPVDCTAR